ncbi:hypothetical protein MTO96_008952 [Rhipicephalus appendiculatus]
MIPAQTMDHLVSGILQGLLNVTLGASCHPECNMVSIKWKLEIRDGSKGSSKRHHAREPVSLSSAEIVAEEQAAPFRHQFWPHLGTPLNRELHFSGISPLWTLANVSQYSCCSAAAVLAAPMTALCQHTQT